MKRQTNQRMEETAIDKLEEKIMIFQQKHAGIVESKKKTTQ